MDRAWHPRFLLPGALAVGLAGFAGAAHSSTPTSNAGGPGPNTGLASSAPSRAAQIAGVVGRVISGAAPLEAVRVSALHTSDKSVHQVLTDAEGNFRFDKLPAGLYRMVAYKAGFVVAVVDFVRSREDARQVLDLELAEAPPGSSPAEDFWAARSRVPADILREILQTPPEASQVSHASAPPLANATFAAEMAAMTGRDATALGESARVTGGELGVAGRMGRLRLDLAGDFWKVAPERVTFGQPAGLDGETRNLTLAVQGDDGHRFDVVSNNRRFVAQGADVVDFDSYQASWSQVEQGRRARVSAQYVSQHNFYGQGALALQAIPNRSETWGVEASYGRDLGDSTHFQAGLRYRDRVTGISPSGVAFAGDLSDDRLDLFGRASHRVQPKILVEYGLYTTLWDGSVSLIPQGGVVLQLSENWQAKAVASHRVPTDAALSQRPRDFHTARYGESEVCSQGEESCYQVVMARRLGSDDESFTVGALQREVGDTVQLFFNDGLFSYLESLYLVNGDQIPEVQVGLSRRLSPTVLTRFEGNVGRGGGGTLALPSDQAASQTYENSVRYLVTSLDTQFQQTSTGVFVSFHRLEQELEPQGNHPTLTAAMPRMELERLQLMLTQDLDFLLNIASNWAVRLDMEVTRGSMLAGAGGIDPDELRKKVLGGFAVRF